MVVEANYGGAGSEGSWMDTWVLEFDFLIVREKRFASWRLLMLFLPPLHMHSMYLFIYFFVKIILEATSHFSIKSTSSV